MVRPKGAGTTGDHGRKIYTARLDNSYRRFRRTKDDLITEDVISISKVIMTTNTSRLPWTAAFFNHDADVRMMKVAVQMADMAIGMINRALLNGFLSR